MHPDRDHAGDVSRRIPHDGDEPDFCAACDQRQNFELLVTVVFFDNLTGGMATTARRILI